MKKITLLALGCAMLMGFSASAQEITYVEDPAQGYTFNKFSDNWFIQAEGGAGVLLSTYDSDLSFVDRVGWKADLAFGKWFTPIVAVRIGGEFAQHHGSADPEYSNISGARFDLVNHDGRIDQNFNNVGAFADVMINLTNWWCGYRPGRIYNGVFYAGLGMNWTFEKEAKGTDAAGVQQYGSWKYAGGKNGPDSHMLTVRAGLLNTLRLSEKFDLLLDLRVDMLNRYVDGYGKRSYNFNPSVLVGFAYKFNKSEWTAPIVGICPTWKYTDAEGDALVARLAAADAKIASLEKQLYDCLHRVTPTPDPKPSPVVSADAPLATIYYPIGKSAITAEQKKVVEAVANVMKDNDNNYVLTGWADNYTGTDKINAKLRKDRVNGVKDALTKLGVGADRLDAQINDGNLTSFGPKCAALDRAVTVNVAK
ncbi:MAG: OmpA family protein [Muribaculaceae bacterium]|nr:OmpA family protein [Muribaculaceae bacterium]